MKSQHKCFKNVTPAVLAFPLFPPTSVPVCIVCSCQDTAEPEREHSLAVLSKRASYLMLCEKHLV